MNHARFLLPLLSLAALLAGSPGIHAAELRFTPADIIKWDAHSFKGRTDYALVDIDGTAAVAAVCTGATASGLFRRSTVDLSKTPILEWRWRVDAVFDDIDEKARSGDDYPARLYVVDERRVAIWRTRALNYVWTSEQPEGSDWPNAFASQARMIAVRSGAPAEKGQWRTERRNVREDFQRYHGQDKTAINAVAVMTDCDNAGQNAKAWFGEIRFLPETD
ncbi:MAG: DUF3047 domain-containing protein [Polycyclovorans sp.]